MNKIQKNFMVFVVDALIAIKTNSGNNLKIAREARKLKKDIESQFKSDNESLVKDTIEIIKNNAELFDKPSDDIVDFVFEELNS